MPPKSERSPMAVDVVEISSSDDEDCVPNTSKRPPSQNVRRPQLQLRQKQSAKTNSLDARSFWKAGGYEIGPSSAKTVPLDGLEHARVHPKFLHSNATSHKWAFGAIAELIDNAVDEIQNGATYVKVDKVDIMKDYSPALLFQDDGGGMDPRSIRKCMSLGYSSKTSNTTIGQYGNGFKTSTMRLGADVIVFSRASCAGKSTQSVGLLSYTFLRKTGQDDVIVPMIDFDISGHCAEPIIDSSQDDWTANLKIILEWSPFDSKEKLMQQFEDIGPHGTKIIIYNLWLNDEGVYELSLDDDDKDIQLRDEALVGGQTKVNKRTVELRYHISYRIRYSLRAYTSILYLRKFANFSIILRGKPVQQYSIADDLNHKKVMTYKPHAVTSSEEIVETTIGFIKEAPVLGISGFNVYHKNRLIRPYWKVTSDGSNKGAGVVGVLEANFIEPAHDKQDFERSSLFIRLESKLKQMVMEYWKGNCELVGHQPPGFYQQMERLHKSKMQKQLPVREGAAELPGMEQDLPVGGTASILPRHIRQEQHGRDNGMNLGVEVPVNGAADGPSDEAYDRRLKTMTIKEISKENIQLFARCEEQGRKESELQRMVEALEKELEDAKRKRDRLSAHLENQKKEITGTRS